MIGSVRDALHRCPTHDGFRDSVTTLSPPSGASLPGARVNFAVIGSPASEEARCRPKKCDLGLWRCLFSAELDESIQLLGLHVLKGTPRSPKANSVCERVSRTWSSNRIDRRGGR